MSLSYAHPGAHGALAERDKHLAHILQKSDGRALSASSSRTPSLESAQLDSSPGARVVRAPARQPSFPALLSPLAWPATAALAAAPATTSLFASPAPIAQSTPDTSPVRHAPLTAAHTGTARALKGADSPFAPASPFGAATGRTIYRSAPVPAPAPPPAAPRARATAPAPAPAPAPPPPPTKPQRPTLKPRSPPRYEEEEEEEDEEMEDDAPPAVPHEEEEDEERSWLPHRPPGAPLRMPARFSPRKLQPVLRGRVSASASAPLPALNLTPPRAADTAALEREAAAADSAEEDEYADDARGWRRAARTWSARDVIRVETAGLPPRKRARLEGPTRLAADMGVSRAEAADIFRATQASLAGARRAAAERAAEERAREGEESEGSGSSGGSSSEEEAAPRRTSRRTTEAALRSTARPAPKAKALPKAALKPEPRSSARRSTRFMGPDAGVGLTPAPAPPKRKSTATGKRKVSKAVAAAMAAKEAAEAAAVAGPSKRKAEDTDMSDAEAGSDADAEGETDAEAAPATAKGKGKARAVGSTKPAPAKRRAGAARKDATPSPEPSPTPEAEFDFPLREVREVAPERGFEALWRRFPASSVGLGGVPPRMPGATYNAPRTPLDLYTPRFTRGVGRAKVGCCPVCAEPAARGGAGSAQWLSMKFSAFNYHMQYFHGISPQSGRPFSPPLAFRTEVRAKPAPHERRAMRQGRCHRCARWVDLEGVKPGAAKVREIYWWKHAAACHKGDALPGDADPFVRDATHERILAESPAAAEELAAAESGASIALHALAAAAAAAVPAPSSPAAATPASPPAPPTSAPALATSVPAPPTPLPALAAATSESAPASTPATPSSAPAPPTAVLAAATAASAPTPLTPASTLATSSPAPAPQRTPVLAPDSPMPASAIRLPLGFSAVFPPGVDPRVLWGGVRTPVPGAGSPLARGGSGSGTAVVEAETGEGDVEMGVSPAPVVDEGSDADAEGEDEDVDAEGEDVDAEGEDVDAEGEDVDAEGEGMDAEGDTEDAEGSTVDAEGSVVDAVGEADDAIVVGGGVGVAMDVDA